MYICAYVYMYIRACVHMYICTYIYMYACIPLGPIKASHCNLPLPFSNRNEKYVLLFVPQPIKNERFTFPQGGRTPVLKPLPVPKGYRRTLSVYMYTCMYVYTCIYVHMYI